METEISIILTEISNTIGYNLSWIPINDCYCFQADLIATNEYRKICLELCFCEKEGIVIINKIAKDHNSVDKYFLIDKIKFTLSDPNFFIKTKNTIASYI